MNEATEYREKPNIFELTREELASILGEQGHKPYRAAQVMNWVYKRYAGSFQEMTDLPKSLRDELPNWVEFGKLELLKKQEGRGDRAKRYLWGTGGKPLVESVLLKYKYGLTGCVSTQVGCPVGCAFCASRHLGFERGLSKAEIVEEFVRMCADEKSRIGRLVFMGTGEPFLNYENVLAAIETLCDPNGYDLSRRRITVSTAGIPEAIREFAKESRGVRLALSLHATKDDVRDKLIPLNRTFPVGAVVEALRDYARATGQRVTVEYMLISRINDSKEDALALAALVEGIDCLVNLIPWNPVPGLPWKRPDAEDIKTFKEVLERNRVKVTLRRSLGGNIEAACGQLRRRITERK